MNDSIKFDLVENKIVDYIKFAAGNLVMVTGGRNMGRSGVIVHRDRTPGGFDIIRIRDVLDREFATRIGNVFVTGEGNKPWVSLPKGKGVKLSVRAFLTLLLFFLKSHASRFRLHRFPRSVIKSEGRRRSLLKKLSEI